MTERRPAPPGEDTYDLGAARQIDSRRVALCVPEKYTRVTDYTDRATCIFFGDSAPTVLLQHERPARGVEVVDLVMANVNEGADCVTTSIGGYFRQDGRRVKEYALREFERSARTLLERNGLAVGDLRAFVGHQAKLRVLEQVAAALGVPPKRHWYNVDVCGNQGAAGVSTTFCQRVESGADALTDGDLILLAVFGSGFTTGSALLRHVAGRD